MTFPEVACGGVGKVKRFVSLAMSPLHQPRKDRWEMGSQVIFALPDNLAPFSTSTGQARRLRRPWAAERFDERGPELETWLTC